LAVFFLLSPQTAADRTWGEVAKPLVNSLTLVPRMVWYGMVY